MKRTSSQDSSNHSKPLDSVENTIELTSQRLRNKRNFKTIQSSTEEQKHTNKRIQIENYRHVFCDHSKKTTLMKKLVPQTFTTNIQHEKVEQTKRPTMGGKTIGSIHKAEPMSSQELKLLSRRINPHEPLPSPHASPRKPPLPNINKKSTLRQFICEPCNKHYKTRNGLAYHHERCKYRKTEVKVIIQCTCSNNSTEGTMIECTQCRTWLHMKCVQETVKQQQEDSFVCPRCLPPPPEEDSFDFLRFFSDESFNAFIDEGTSIDFNSVDWCNDIPSLLDNYTTSETFSSNNNIPSSPILQSDWLHFTHLIDDFSNKNDEL
ncbi:hypothetical protein G6F57_005866 [Rhizopus arrhizus]|nr:hypothetical protein G6F22_013868 [Rhizopus arrhizus]KAG0783864.1 hypothetical protein G6F21_010269 [Rhizopus arrhizus]KAG0814647.1 hypothetical protein G6F20_004616 [Rhizopus arrhizus]KAG0833438.1 hypothetical protein G6F18_006771 [Rhizopus arrhizus]KAG0841764.1 hypothetical protein G6F19_001379 [Rhizopus arrhizus]